MANNEDGSINFSTKINTNGLEGQINNVTKKINKLADNKTLTAFSRLGASVTGLQSAFSMVSGAIKKVSASIKENNELLKIQQQAEKQLAVAVKNNPYLDNNSIQNLKNYASELQNISNIGDEAMLPMMAQLIASGRTEAEVQKIMAASLDLSASGMMSMEQAVQSLNASYSGNIGLLGRQDAELKSLTADELKNGKAIDIVAKKYKGMAQATIDTSKQLANARGDFKEALGQLTQPTADGWNNFWKSVLQGGTNAINQLVKERDSKVKGSNIISEVQAAIDSAGIKKKDKAGQKAVAMQAILGFSDADLQKTKEYIQQFYDEVTGLDNRSDLQLLLLPLLDDEIEKREKLAKLEKERSAQNANDAEKNKTASDAYSKFKQTIAAAEENIKQRRELGVQISEEEELQTMLNVKTEAYIQLLKDANGTITGESQREKDFVQSVVNGYQKLAEMQEKVKQKEERLNKNKEISGGADSVIAEAVNYTDESTKLLSTQIDAEIALLDDYIQELKDAGEEYQAFTEKRKQLEELQTAVVKKEQEEQHKATLENVVQNMELINDYITQFSDIASGITDLIKTNNEKQTDAELTEISKQYNDGLISYEEFCEKKGEINKKAKREEYKAELWSYYSNLASAVANVALGVTKALASAAYPINLINAGLVGASGAIQIATLTANKPTAPSFATGGIVGGSSYTGDRIQANVNSGEMILNASQQKQLWNVANGRGSTGSVSMPVTVVNNNGSQVHTSLSKKGLKIIVDNIVNSSARNGDYAQAISTGNNINNGVRYL